MTTPRESKSWRFLVLLLLLMILIMAGLQIWSAISTRQLVDEAMRAPIGQDVNLEKSRQEAIAKRIENASRRVVQTNLATSLGAWLGVVVSAFGAMLALFGYFDAREKDRLDRLEAQRKDREDRLSSLLSETLTRLVAPEARERVVGAAGLLPFFAPDREDFHLQALAALVAAARSEDERPEVRQGIRLGVERAFGAVNRAVLRQVSWQGVRLQSINLAGRDVSGIDLRDAYLENANLSGARLIGTDLTAAKLQGARLEWADLTAANLTYADLAGAVLSDARLQQALIDGIKVLNLDVRNTDFSGIASGWRGVPWDATRNWREARFDPDVRRELETRYGPVAPPLKVLMLMWEIPPFVAGGTWTACYHLVRNLRRRGADVTVVVPWDRGAIIDTPFGIDVPLVALGIEPPDGGQAIYGGAVPAWSPYGGGYSPAWSPYGGGAPFWSTYAGFGGPYGYGGQAPAYGIYGRAGYSGTRDALSGSILYRLIATFRRRLDDYVADHPVDLIHAHDWVTFDAARAASDRRKVPWIAHFHSIEADRQQGDEDELTKRIELGASDAATRIVVPSAVTKARLMAAYGSAEARIEVVPNMLSEAAAPTAEMGRFETKRVVFLGRLSRQKGVDRFAKVAAAVGGSDLQASFEVFGDGEQRDQLAQWGLIWRGSLGWDERGKAFGGASAVLVPSRSEPFGMVILEAMRHRVPVIYPPDSGAAEVLQSGIKVPGNDMDAMAGHVTRLLSSIGEWEGVVRAEGAEIEDYPRRGYEDEIIAVWRQTASEAVAA